MDLVNMPGRKKVFWGKYMKLRNFSETKTFTAKREMAAPEAYAQKGAMKIGDPVWLLGCCRKLVNG